MKNPSLAHIAQTGLFLSFVLMWSVVHAQTQPGVLPTLGLPAPSGNTAQPATTAPASTPTVITIGEETGIDADTDAGDVRLAPNDTILIDYQADESLSLDESTLARIAYILDQKLHKLDKNGRVQLPIIGTVVLAGLNEREAARRLVSEPLLADVGVTVKVLPVQPQGISALRRFGYDAFTDAASGFVPVVQMPVPSNYIIGPGDSLDIQLFGNTTEHYTITVGNDGVLAAPEIGAIQVAGLTFEEVKKDIQERIATRLIGVNAHVSMAALRTMSIFVLGEVQQPGAYTVSALSTLTNALLASGGVKESGSLRNITLKRNNRVVSRMDLYDLLMRGDKRRDARLKPGDVIFVPPVGATAAVSGEVIRPAIYELDRKLSAGELLKLAGGLSPDASPGDAKLQRLDAGQRRTIVDVDLTDDATLAMPIRNGDYLDVPSVPETLSGKVTLKGHIAKPGVYQWRAGMVISDVIESSDDLAPQADAQYVLIRRARADNGVLEPFSVNLNDVFKGKTTPVGLLPDDEIIVFQSDASANRQALLSNVVETLETQGRVDAPARIVSIGGAVNAPGQYPLEREMRISDLIRAAGSLDESAFMESAELTRYRVAGDPSQGVTRYEVPLQRVLSGDSDADWPLLPRDYLVVKPSPWRYTPRTVTVKGEVNYPGEYPLSPGETLNSVIERAGGLTAFAFPQGAIFLREDLKQREQDYIDRLIQQLEASLASSVLSRISNPAHEEALIQGQFLLEQLRSIEPVGRLVINLPSLLKADNDKKRKRFDVVLQNQDTIMIPPVIQDVTVMGEVHFPTAHIWQTDHDRWDYIDMSGGLTEKAFRSHIYVIRANGAVIPGNRLRQFRSQSDDHGDWEWEGYDVARNEIRPGDTIIAPMKLDRLKTLTVWESVSQIIFNIGVTIAQLERAF